MRNVIQIYAFQVHVASLPSNAMLIVNYDWVVAFRWWFDGQILAMQHTMDNGHKTGVNLFLSIMAFNNVQISHLEIYLTNINCKWLNVYIYLLIVNKSKGIDEAGYLILFRSPVLFFSISALPFWLCNI